MKRREFFRRGLAAATAGGASVACLHSMTAAEPTGSDGANRAFFRVEQRGAKLETLRAEGYIQHQNHKKVQSKPIRYSTLDLAGTLTVIDPEMFLRTLYQGIGPAKAFGCGLMLVRRI